MDNAGMPADMILICGRIFPYPTSPALGHLPVAVPGARLDTGGTPGRMEVDG